MRRLILALAAALTVVAVPAVASGPGKPRPTYDVTITRTEHGIPHIVGADLGSVGYGWGYAFAQDNLCTMAAGYVTVSGERSKWFGPDATYQQRGNGVTVTNLDSDFFFRQIDDSGIVDQLLDRPPPHGPLPELREGVRGYVAGYNRYLRDIGGAAGVADPACTGQPWVREITERDAYLRFYQLVLLAGQDVVIEGIANATPPPGVPAPAEAALGDASVTGARIADAWRERTNRLGSNAVAVGRAGSRDGTHGVLLGNPHFPWVDTERFYQAHLTIPGELDVSGASLFGVPITLIGHNATMAWSHTVSTAFRFTPYQLTLVPGSPTTYLVDGEPTPMDPREVTVSVRRPDGSLEEATRTLWWTRYGPVFTSILGIPLPWTPGTAFAIRDANVDNFRVFNHFLETARAPSARAMLDVLVRYQGIPWVNTIAADKGGDALYADIGTIPHVTDEQAQECNTALGHATFALLGLPVLDGSRTACDWGRDPDAVTPGIFGPGKLPHLLRDDYVTNSNDSYWLSNPHAPLTGFDRIIGTEETERTLRTRIGLVMTEERITGADDRGPAGFTRLDMQDMVFNNRLYAGELGRDALVAMCRRIEALGVVPTSSGAPVAIGDACDVLAAWDLHENLDSRGALLFRRFFDHAYGATPSMWKHEFDVADPVRTPHTLNTEHPQVMLALGDAIADLTNAGVPLDADLGSHQYVEKGGRRIPIHGGPGDPNGNFNAIWAGWSDRGVVPPEGGSSFVQVVTWDDGPCPDVATILTYSQSTDPTRPHFADQTELFSGTHWVPGRFCRAQIRAAPVRDSVRLVGS